MTIAAVLPFPLLFEPAAPPPSASRRSKVDVYNTGRGVPSGQARPRLSELRYHVAGLWRVFSGEMSESMGAEEWVGSLVNRDDGNSLDESLGMGEVFCRRASQPN